ncbi:MAG: hypothetical protein Ct9H300mP18_10880 [Candidatus Neomarinimicrobiota bacterium]|nr:MAG: hypothetical protein Ct9H300mP18_10880 [Candidatus Neomarinimicrobiota bacterium]
MFGEGNDILWQVVLKIEEGLAGAAGYCGHETYRGYPFSVLQKAIMANN